MAYEIKHGRMRFAEVFGLFESSILIATIVSYLMGYVVPGILLSWVFGAVFATMADKAKIRRERYILNFSRCRTPFL